MQTLQPNVWKFDPILIMFEFLTALKPRRPGDQKLALALA
jgi:hypothetical protein